MICSACGRELNQGAKFCSNCGQAVVGQSAIPVNTRLTRPRYGRVIAGVCAGFAQHYGWDVVLVRIILSVLVVFGCGTPILAYVIAWMLMPNEPNVLPAQPVDPPSTQSAAPPNSQPTA